MRWIVSFFIAVSGPVAQAYIGPGMGAGVVATVLGLIAAVVFAVVGVIYYPIKRWIKRLKSRRDAGKVGGA